MTYEIGTDIFEVFATALDRHYLELNNEGYDLAELEAIEVNNSTITLIFDEDYSNPVTLSFDISITI